MLSLQQPLDQPTSPTTDSASQKISRAERRKAAFAAKNINSTTACENSFDDNQSLSSTPSFEIPSLHEPFSSVASYVELIAKRIRTLKKLWSKIQKYDEIVENGGGKAALNKDQMDALNRKPEVYWSLRELEDLHKQATTFENEEAVRLRRIKQEADRAHTIAIARVREEERKIADARVSEAVKSVHALLNVMPTRDVLSDQEVSVLEIFKNFMFGEVLAQQNESDQIIPSILSNLESGAEVPVGDYDLTYAHIKPLINKVLYPELTTMSPSADAPTEEQAAEVERTFASNAADQCADAREEAADSDASTLHNAAAEMREAVEALHNFHIAEGHAPVDVYTEQSTEIVLSEEVHVDEEQDMGECGFMNPTEIRFGSVNEVDSPPMDMITEESREISTSHTVVTSMVGEAGHHQVIVDDETVTTVTSTSHIVTITDVDDAQLIAGDVAPQVTPSAVEAPEAEQTSRPANQPQQPRQNRNRYRQNRYHNNGNNNAHNNGNSNMNNNGNANVNSHQNRQRSPPHQQKSQYRNHPKQNQQQPQHEPTNDGGNWQTHGPRYPRANRPQQNQYRNGNGPNGPNNGGAPNGNVGGPGGNNGGRGGFRGRGRGGMRGGHGGNGPQHQTNAPFQPHHQQGYRGNYRRPYNANNNGPAPASTNAAPVVSVAE